MKVFFLTICSKIFLLLICCLWGFFSNSSISSFWQFAKICAIEDSLKMASFFFGNLFKYKFCLYPQSGVFSNHFWQFTQFFLTICSNWSFVVRVQIIWWSKAIKATQLNFSQFRRFGVLQPTTSVKQPYQQYLFCWGLQFVAYKISQKLILLDPAVNVN